MIFFNMNFKGKLFFGYAVIVVFGCLVGFFGFDGMREIKTRLDDMNNNLIPSIVTANEIDHHAQQHRRLSLRYLLEKNSSTRKQIEARILREEKQITESLNLMKSYPLLQEELKLVTELAAACQTYLDSSMALRKKSDSASSYLLIESDNEQVYDLFTQVENLTNRLSRYNAEEASAHFEQSGQVYSNVIFWLVTAIIFSILLTTLIALIITRSIVNPLQQVLEAVQGQQRIGREKARLVKCVSEGDLGQVVEISTPLQIETVQLSKDEAGMLLRAVVGMSESQALLDQGLAEMTNALRLNSEQEARRDWLKNGQNELNTILRGDKSTDDMARLALAFLTEYLGSGVGAFYIFNEKDKELQMVASYASGRSKQEHDRIPLGEGLAGQAALEKKMMVVSDAPPEYLRISSGLGEAEAAYVVVLPLLHNSTLSGLLELGSFHEFSNVQLEFLTLITESLAVALNVNHSRQIVDELLEQTQCQTEELRVQQEELQQTNEELEERAQLLEMQREQISAKNREVELASRELERKAGELEKVSAYKSEFLANMSHELRTPLNSLMILSSLLRDNREGNLTAKQVEFAATINGAGRDLLNLINDILDLSKIESGHLEFHYEELVIPEICQQLEAIFSPIIAERGIEFKVMLEESVPETIVADSQRTQQILKNLLSNACKFTSQGSVSLRVYTPDSGLNPLPAATVAFDVTDTGIGIPADKLSLIFQAFKQADGSTSRTYGGTGLGLSISRQLARSMGGDVVVQSESGQGSRFTLYLPITDAGARTSDHTHYSQTAEPVRSVVPEPRKSDVPAGKGKALDLLPAPIPDDRDNLQNGSKSILIIEDDLIFARVLVDMVRGRHFSALVADEGESGILMAERYQPSAIILDVMLPNIDGWGVMRSLKDNPVTRHIPVHFITCLEERQKAMSMGAIGFDTKPVSSQQLDSVFCNLETAIDKITKKLLIVEDDEVQVKAMVALLGERNVAISIADSGSKAVEMLSREQFDCIVLDLGLADMGAFELLEQLKRLDPGRRIPVIIHTGRELTQEDERRLHHYAESIIIKGAKSPERLLNEVTLFLHLIEKTLDPGKQRMIRASLDKEAMLAGKKILIVDDDMRNIFSLSSALAEKNIIIHEAENGREALKQLDTIPDMDLVLMDIMMPEMDGYEAMRTIRKDPRFTSLPIIALTAKAMKGDREECLKAGASDYIPKPVDMEKLFSLLRVWLYSADADDRVKVGQQSASPHRNISDTTT